MTLIDFFRLTNSSLTWAQNFTYLGESPLYGIRWSKFGCEFWTEYAMALPSFEFWLDKAFLDSRMPSKNGSFTCGCCIAEFFAAGYFRLYSSRLGDWRTCFGYCYWRELATGFGRCWVWTWMCTYWSLVFDPLAGGIALIPWAGGVLNWPLRARS